MSILCLQAGRRQDKIAEEEASAAGEDGDAGDEVDDPPNAAGVGEGEEEEGVENGGEEEGEKVEGKRPFSPTNSHPQQQPIPNQPSQHQRRDTRVVIQHPAHQQNVNRQYEGDSAKRDAPAAHHRQQQPHQ